jgi:hypothetical protein
MGVSLRLGVDFFLFFPYFRSVRVLLFSLIFVSPQPYFGGEVCYRIDYLSVACAYS